MKSRVLWSVPALALLVVVGTWLSRDRRGATPAIRGQVLARELGCFACHGPEGLGGIADPLAPGGEIPDWRYETFKLFVESESELREWILDGTTAREAARGRHGRHRSIAPMPAYADLVSRRQVDDLVAYLLAVSGWRREYSEEAFLGWKLATRLGCFGCHGPSGMGGVPNPGGGRAFVPPWDGAEFADLVRDDDELRDWILYGRTARVWGDPASRELLEGLRTPMPAYHDHLSDVDVAQLVAYVRSVQEGGSDARGENEAAEVIGVVALPRWRGR